MRADNFKVDKNDENRVFCEFLHTIKKEKMLDNAKSVLVGFSGGADSTALMDIMSEYCLINGIELHALHVNHGIRGAEADADEEFCREFCVKRSIPFESVYADIPFLSKERGKGLEETARDERYAAFYRYADTHGIDRIATAHNATDNLETLIFNIARGSGLSGVCGIPPVRGKIIRPLLGSSKSEIEDYCRERGLDFRTDSTNSDKEYTRNYIRGEIIPRMRKLNPLSEHAAVKMCSILRSDNAALEFGASAYSLADGRKTISALPEGYISRILRREYKSFSGRTLESVHIFEMTALIRSDKAKGSVSLPDDSEFRADRDSLFFCTDAKAKNAGDGYTVTLDRGENLLPCGGAVYITSNPGSDEASKDIKRLKNIYKLSMNVMPDFDKINGIMVARSRKPGDSYRFGGMNRKVKKLLQTRKMTEAQKKSIPVICDGDGILWVPHFKLRDGAAGENSGKLYIYYFGD